ncbi:MAG: hypothetical protein Q9191_007819 [Dirinaria sp. TL-2023a]
MGKQYRRPPTYFDDDDDLYDIGNGPEIEKHEYYRQTPSPGLERDEEPLYSSSSRESSGSYQPMLRQSPHKRKDSISRHTWNRRARYLCLALLSIIVLFILHLIRASWVEAKRLELGPIEKPSPPKPPPWEGFEFLKRYHGGIRTLIPKNENVPEYPSETEQAPRAENNNTVQARTASSLPKSIPFDPYPDYDSESYISKYHRKHECFLDLNGLVRIPKVHYYEGNTRGFPDPVMGSHDVLGLRNDICFERFGRLGAYGYGYSVRRGGVGAGLHGDRDGADDMWLDNENVTEVNYSNIQWAKLQKTCAAKNGKRFAITSGWKSNLFQEMGTSQKHADSADDAESGDDAASDTTKLGPGSAKSNGTDANASAKKTNLMHIPRTAILIRTWWNYEYTPEDIIYLRSLVTELSLMTGGEYVVHFLIHVKDDNIPIWAEQRVYDRVLENSLPKEFRGMGTLWSERQMSLIYGGLQESFFRDLPVHGVYRGTFLPVQYFASRNPDFDFFWNWEMDVRYTGQWYHLLDKVQSFAKAQPRKGLWERSGRFYIPSVHGSWEDFKQMVRFQTEMGTDNPNNVWSSLKVTAEGGAGTPQPKADTPVWGPLSPADMLTNQNDTAPPVSYEKDKYVWGVDEEADLIVFNPIFDPDGTTWFFTGDVTGYNTTDGLPPRRAAITTTCRLSKKLLQTMHRETMLSRHLMFSEMWPASIALHHGYKAVYAPHPVYIDRRWPTAYLNAVMNGGRNGATGGARTSVFGSREHNFRGTTWFYDAGFSPNLWKRWLGYKVDNDGGEQAELAGEGRMCVPGMLLHPVKGVGMVVEGARRVKEKEEEGRDIGD